MGEGALTLPISIYYHLRNENYGDASTFRWEIFSLNSHFRYQFFVRVENRTFDCREFIQMLSFVAWRDNDGDGIQIFLEFLSSGVSWS